MNRRGFTAMMDAVLFIVIMSLTVSAMTQMHETVPEQDDSVREACDTLMFSRITPSDAGYRGEDRVMFFSDLWALSLLGGDGLVTAKAEGYFSDVFPFDDVGFRVEYRGIEEAVNMPEKGWTQSVERTYQIEFGGELSLTIYR